MQSRGRLWWGLILIDFLPKAQFFQLEVWEIPVALIRVLLRQKAVWLPLQAGCTLPSWCGKNPLSSHCLEKDPRKRRISCICPDIYCPTCHYSLTTQDIPSKPTVFCGGTTDFYQILSNQIFIKVEVLVSGVLMYVLFLYRDFSGKKSTGGQYIDKPTD